MQPIAPPNDLQEVRPSGGGPTLIRAPPGPWSRILGAFSIRVATLLRAASLARRPAARSRLQILSLLSMPTSRPALQTRGEDG